VNARVAVLYVCLALAGCLPEPIAPAPAIEATPQGPVRVGSRTGALEIRFNGSDVDVDEVSYQVTREGAPVKEGSFDVAGPYTSFSGLVSQLEPYDRYDIALAGQSSTPGTTQRVSCNGGGRFAIAVEETTALSIRMQCGAPAPADPDACERCPGIDAVRATPRDAPLGTCIKLRADVNVADTGDAPLEFTWEASSGRLTKMVGNTAEFECTEIGVATIMVSVSDADSECEPDTVPLYVTCCAERKR
jgi:ribosomal protein L40E